MRHEKIIKRSDGSRTKIEVDLYVDRFISNGFKYNTAIFTCKPQKRTWELVSSDATPAEVLQAKIELWEKLSPIKQQSPTTAAAGKKE